MLATRRRHGKPFRRNRLCVGAGEVPFCTPILLPQIRLEIPFRFIKNFSLPNSMKKEAIPTRVRQDFMQNPEWRTTLIALCSNPAEPWCGQLKRLSKCALPQPHMVCSGPVA